MKALIRDHYGPPEVLELREVGPPVPKERQVLVRVHACSLNDWDWGLLHAPTTLLGHARRFFVPILGSDIAGVVIEVGSEARRFKPGDEVYGDLSGFGGWGGGRGTGNGESEIVFGNVRILDGGGEPPYSGEVTVAGNRIKAISRAGNGYGWGTGGGQRIDGRGMTLMPGLIDAHLHLSWNNAPGIDPIRPGMIP